MKPLKLNIQFFAGSRDTMIGVDIDFDISEVKKQINVLNGALNTNRSAWEQTAVETENWAKTAVGVQARIESLNEKYKLQEELVAKIGKELNLYSTVLAKNHPTMVKLGKELANAQAKWSATGVELEKQKKKLIEVNGEYKTLDEILGSLENDIKLANSEFSKATAGMDKWENSTKGLDAKLTQLNSIISAQDQKVGTLETEYRKLVDAKEENTEEAKELLTALNNEKAALGKTQAELVKYSDETAKTRAKAGDLEEKIKELTDKYKKLESQEGDNKDSLKKLKREIDDCEAEYSQLTNELEEHKKQQKRSNDVLDEANDRFTVLKGTVANLISDGIKKLADMTIEAAKQVVDMGISFESAFAGEIILRPSC